jgi:hypothetical protein
LTANHTQRRRHQSQRGLTLIEILIAASITVAIASALAIALSLSVRMVGTQGVVGQQVASNSLLRVTSQMSTDVSHAECVVTTGGSSCPGAAVALTGACKPGFTVCVAWCESGSATTASYFLNGGQLVRQGSAGSLATLASDVQSFTPTIPSGGSSPAVHIDLVAGTDRPEQATFTARSAVTGSAACP